MKTIVNLKAGTKRAAVPMMKKIATAATLVTAALGIGAVALLGAPAAGASEDGYIRTLENRGVEITDEGDVIDWGREVCGYLEDGYGPSEVSAAIIRDGTPPQIAYSVVLAANSQLCFGRG